MATMEVSDMVRLVNEAFQRLVVYNMDLWKTWSNLPLSVDSVSKLGIVEGQINSLEDVTWVEDFSCVSRIVDGIKISILDFYRTLKDLENDLA